MTKPRWFGMDEDEYVYTETYTCPDCGHKSNHDPKWGCMAEIGDGGDGSVSQITFCKCRTGTLS